MTLARDKMTSFKEEVYVLTVVSLKAQMRFLF